MKTYYLSLFLILSGSLFSQQPASTLEALEQGLFQKQKKEASSLFKNVPFKNIGPSIMSGRVVDVAVNPNNPIEFYVGYASGGLWYTSNNGTSFEPVMDSAQTINVGDIAVDWKNGTIWIGQERITLHDPPMPESEF